MAASLLAAQTQVVIADTDRLEIFDAHLHYNQEPNPFYSLDQVLEIFRRNAVTGILATSRPNKGTHQLMDAKPPGLWVVPFIRPYRTRPDIQTWFNDPSIYDLVKSEYERGYYRGIGEFHIYGKSAATRMGEEDRRLRGRAKSLSACPLRRGSAAHPVLAQSEGEDHLGAYRLFDAAVARRANCSTTYPDLWGELSYRSGITDRRRQAQRRIGATCSRAFRPLPDRLGYLDQRALVFL